MRKGWYIHCPSCGAQVFLSRWKPIATWMFRKYRWTRYDGCDCELTLIRNVGTVRGKLSKQDS